MEFRDLKSQYQKLKTDIDNEMHNAVESARFISGPQVKELETELAEYVGVKHCIACGSGTDAITLALMALNVSVGDAVFVPDFTFFATAECPAFIGATPVFVDVDEDTYNMDPDSLEKAIARVVEDGKYNPKAVIAVDLFGLPADYERIKAICDEHGLVLIEDGAQGFGGSINDKRACSFGDVSTTSFFPAKPLGCYGDGGAVFTDNEEYAELLRSYAVHGKSGNDKYNNIRIGMNSRLDTIQAAILKVKLNAFIEYELEAVNKAAASYAERLKDSIFKLPVIDKSFYSSWAQYTIQLPDSIDRNDVQKKMKDAGIPTMVYYAKPMHKQGAFIDTYSANADCPVSEHLCKTVLSLPMHPYLNEDDINKVVNTLNSAIE